MPTQLLVGPKAPSGKKTIVRPSDTRLLLQRIAAMMAAGRSTLSRAAGRNAAGRLRTARAVAGARRRSDMTQPTQRDDEHHERTERRRPASSQSSGPCGSGARPRPEARASIDEGHPIAVADGEHEQAEQQPRMPAPPQAADPARLAERREVLARSAGSAW